MKGKKIILNDAIGEDIEKVQSIIAKTKIDIHKQPALPQADSLYELIFEHFSKKMKSSFDQFTCLDAYEKAAAVFRVTAVELRKEMDLLNLENRLLSQKEDLIRNGLEEDTKDSKKKEDERPDLQRKITDAIFFSNRYALYFAGQVGLSFLNSEKTERKQKLVLSEYDSSKANDKITELLTKQLGQHICELIGTDETPYEPSDENLKDIMKDFFTTWVNQFRWDSPAFKDISDEFGVEKINLKYDKFSLQAGEFKKKSDIILIDGIKKVRKKDIIGAQNFVDEVWDYMEKLACYKPEEGRNANRDIPYSIFVGGAPGCGKTFTAHALMREFAEYCRVLRIPCWVFTHSITDYGSKYQNESPNKLKAKVDKINEFPGPVIGYIADIDTLAQSRKSNPSAEEEKLIGLYFQIFDGTLIEINGKVLWLSDANYVENIDDGTKSRLFNKQLYVNRFDKQEQFTEYARKLITLDQEEQFFPEKEWNEVGAYLLEGPLSNREITHVVGQIRSDYKTPKNMALWTYKKQVDYINQQLKKKITKDFVIGMFEKYIETRMEIERETRKARATDDFERFQTRVKQEPKRTSTG